MIFGSKMSVSALEIENSDIVVKDIDEDSMNIEKEYVGTIDLGNGITCEMYEIKPYVSPRSSTVYGGNDFYLRYEGTFFGYLRQTTTWTCDGTNRPTFVESSNTFYSTDSTKHYLSFVTTNVDDYAVSAKRYAKIASITYNSSHIGVTSFATICDKNGNCSYVSADV